MSHEPSPGAKAIITRLVKKAKVNDSLLLFLGATLVEQGIEVHNGKISYENKTMDCTAPPIRPIMVAGTQAFLDLEAKAPPKRKDEEEEDEDEDEEDEDRMSEINGPQQQPQSPPSLKRPSNEQQQQHQQKKAKEDGKVLKDTMEIINKFKQRDAKVLSAIKKFNLVGTEPRKDWYLSFEPNCTNEQMLSSGLAMLDDIESKHKEQAMLAQVIARVNHAIMAAVMAKAKDELTKEEFVATKNKAFKNCGDAIRRYHYIDTIGNRLLCLYEKIGVLAFVGKKIFTALILNQLSNQGFKGLLAAVDTHEFKAVNASLDLKPLPDEVARLLDTDNPHMKKRLERIID